MKIIKRGFRIILFIPALLFIIFFTFYKRVISPWLPNACRYNPTCSEYGIESLRKYGLFKGLYLTFKRLSRCHPWGGHGYDPVP